MPAPRSCTRIVMACGSGPASMISRLMSGTICPRLSRSTTATSSTATTACGLPTLRWLTGRIGSVPTRCQSSGASMPATGPMSTAASITSGLSVGYRVTSRSPASVRMRCGSRSPRRRGQRLCETADAVAAHLGSRAVGVVQHHSCRVSGFALADQQPIGPDAATTVAQPSSQRGQIVDMRVERDQEVVAQPVVLRQFEICHARSSSGSASATGSLSMSIQRMRGSRRNHRSCRTANCRVRVMIVSIAASSVLTPSR